MKIFLWILFAHCAFCALGRLISIPLVKWPFPRKPRELGEVVIEIICYALFAIATAIFLFRYE